MAHLVRRKCFPDRLTSLRRQTVQVPRTGGAKPEFGNGEHNQRPQKGGFEV